MRVVGGEYKGAAIKAPKDKLTRPTSDRVREAVFNILAHSIEGFDLNECRVLDLFAGTGALGLEALSRGAKFCLFVEERAQARGIIRENIEALGLTGNSKLWRRDVTRLGPARTMGQFDLVFADPPYDQNLLDQTLTGLRDGDWLNDGAICVLEERANSKLTLPAQYTLLDQRRYGDTEIFILRAASLSK